MHEIPAGLTLVPLSIENLDEAIKFCVSIFLKHNPISHAFGNEQVGVFPDNKLVEVDLMRPALEEALPQNLSYALRDVSGALAAVCVNDDYYLCEQLWASFKSSSNAPVGWRASNAVFGPLGEAVRCTKTGEYFHIFILASSPGHKGAAKYLIQESLRLGAKQGFPSTLIEATNPVTSHLVYAPADGRLQYFSAVLLRAVELSTFKFEEHFPLSEFKYPYALYRIPPLSSADEC